MSLALYFCIFFLSLKSQTTNAKKGFGPGEQDWGHIKIRESSQMFWWLFYVNPQNKLDSFNVHEKPLLIWLQGGPGESASGIGNFMEIGPLDVDLKPRIHSWTNDYNILFIDSPVGTGFSYEESEQEIKLSDNQIIQDLLEFMKSFMTMNPNFIKTPIYVLGESYGGKVAANFVWEWWKNQDSMNMTTNLTGIVLCSPWVSPVDSVRALPAYLFNLGLFDDIEYYEITRLVQSTIHAINRNNWLRAFHLWVNTFQRSLQIMNNGNSHNIFEITTPLSRAHYHFTDYYETNTLYMNGITDWEMKLEILMNEVVKNSLDLKRFNNTWNTMNWGIYEKLKANMMKPATLAVDRILIETSLKVFVLSGQLDFMVPNTGTLRWIKSLKWNLIENWKKTTKVSFSVNNILEGYVKEYDKLKLFWIYRAGHMIPKDNPRAMSAILKDLTG